MIERMEVSRPPGVFMVIRIRLACWSLVWPIPRTMYSARIGSISPSMCSSTTFEAAAEDEEAALEDDCATAPWLKTKDEPATKHTNRIKQRNERRAILADIIAAELLPLRKFRKTFVNPRISLE